MSFLGASAPPGISEPPQYPARFSHRRQLKAGDLRNARTTLDKLVALLGLAVPAREQPITMEAVDREIARLEAELAGLEEQAP
jgi:hypothetical protein